MHFSFYIGRSLRDDISLIEIPGEKGHRADILINSCRLLDVNEAATMITCTAMLIFLPANSHRAYLRFRRMTRVGSFDTSKDESRRILHYRVIAFSFFAL